MATGLLPRDVQQALGLLREDPTRDHSIKDLAKACGVAPRTLQGHFQHFLGQSPLVVLRDIRLDLARRELLLARAADRVTDVAARVGFGHLGRFAGWYQERHGEAPSETLRRARGHASRLLSNSFPLPFAFDRPVIAVLAFRFTGPPVRHAADLSEEFAFALMRLRWLTVGAPYDARYHLRGAVHTGAAGQLRIRVVLVDAENGHALWADTWTGDREDAYDFEVRVAHRITAKLQSVIRALETHRAWRRREPEELSAWELTTRALSRATVLEAASLTEGMELAEKAIEMTPRDPLPLALAAWCQGMNIFDAPDWSRRRDAARAFAERAARLDGSDPIVHALLAGAYVSTYDFDASEAHAERAIALDGGCSWGWQRRGWSKIYRGDVAEAMDCFQLANDLGPAGPMHFLTLFGFASVNFEIGHYAEAARWWKLGMVESPAVVRGHRFMAPALALAGRKEEGRASLEALRRSHPDWIFGDPGTLRIFTNKFNDRMADGFELIGLRPQ